MVTVEDMSIDRLREIGISDFKVIMGSNSLLDNEGYLIASTDEYRLYWANNFTGNLASGAQIRRTNGYLITQRAFNDRGNLRQAVQPIAFYPFENVAYSTITDADKQEVADNYNAAVEGAAVETVDDVKKEQSRNELGETYAEEQARLEQEAADRKAAESAAQNVVLDEESVIREDTYDLTRNYESSDYNVSRDITMRMIEVKTGTVANPQVSYRVEELNLTASNPVVWSQNAATQEEAETLYDSRVESLTAQFNARVDEEFSERAALLERQAADIAAQQAADAAEQARVNEEFYEELESEGPQTRQESWTTKQLLTDTQSPITDRLLAGDYQWQNGGRVLKLNDIDTPFGAPSGSVFFRVPKGMKLNLRMYSESNRANTRIEGVYADRKVTMSEGDKLSIDIDGENPDITQFRLVVGNEELVINEPIDDEFYINISDPTIGFEGSEAPPNLTFSDENAAKNKAYKGKFTDGFNWWIVLGVAVAVIGIGLLIWSARKPKPSPTVMVAAPAPATGAVCE